MHQKSRPSHVAFSAAVYTVQRVAGPDSLAAGIPQAFWITTDPSRPASSSDVASDAVTGFGGTPQVNVNAFGPSGFLLLM